MSARTVTTQAALDAALAEAKWQGRNRVAAPDGSNVAPATMAGVRMLLRHLKKGGSSVILPDQVPGEGEGEWVEFFGRPAYTMTLTGRLQESTGAAIVFCFAQRLPEGRGFALYSGNDDTALPYILLGGHGVISVTANVAPREMAQMCAAALAGDFPRALALNRQLLPLHLKLFVEANPIPVKWALAKMGRIPAGIRLPLTPLSDAHHETVLAALKASGVMR